MSNTDAGKPVAQFTDSTLSTIQSFGSSITAAAEAAGVSPLATDSSGQSSSINRLTNPTLNDLGIAHIQLGTAMDAVAYYNEAGREMRERMLLEKQISHANKMAWSRVSSVTSVFVVIFGLAAIFSCSSSRADNFGFVLTPAYRTWTANTFINGPNYQSTYIYWLNDGATQWASLKSAVDPMGILPVDFPILKVTYPGFSVVLRWS